VLLTRVLLARSAGAVVVIAGIAACTGGGASDGGAARAYVPRVRDVTVTTVPLLVKEEQAVFPFLRQDFARGGVLDGKEVYAFSPSTITVVEGDTLHLTLLNPEDDAHSFMLPDLAVPMRGQSTTAVTYVARKAGIFPFVCAIQAHLPMMSGQLVVLSAGRMAGAARPSPHREVAR
jgi:plastocyanin